MLLLGALAASPYAGYRALERAELRARSFTRADADGDGRPLLVDADADGDGPDVAEPDADHDGIANGADAAAHARTMVGRHTDPLMGRHGNVLGRLGWIVCTDVVVEAWLAAGVSLPAHLVETARAHPEWFEIDASNRPGDPYFVRRVRNYRPLFERSPSLEMDGTPQVGDWAFFPHHVVLVVATRPGSYLVVEAYAERVEVVPGRDVESRFGPPLGFGRARPGSP